MNPPVARKARGNQQASSYVVAWSVLDIPTPRAHRRRRRLVAFSMLPWRSSSSARPFPPDKVLTTCDHAGAGLWHPPAPQLAAIRKTLTDHPERLKSILEAPAFRESFLDHHDAVSPVEAFAKHNAEDALKTAPKVRSLLL